jgi:hypothetical protein
MDHVREYDVVCSSDMDTFVGAVNTFLTEGWQLHGELTLDKEYYLQVVVR